MPSGSDGIAAWLANGLVTGSLQGGLAIAIVWLLCRRMARVPPSVEAALWWLAALKLLIALAPLPAISVPVLPAPDTATAVAIAGPPPDAYSTFLARPSASPSGIPWIPVVIAIWLTGVLLQVRRLLLAHRDLQRIVRASAPIGEPESAIVVGCARSLGLNRIPDVRLSHEIGAPLVAGIRRPLVLIPADARFASEDLHMALCHELMHVRRRDLALGWVPALAERLFFFHPLARFAAREYVTAREAACDAAVVRALGIAPDAYGRLLVRLGIGASDPALAAGGAPASMSSLRRRLDMLQRSPLIGHSRRIAWALVVVAILAMIPFRLAAKAPPATPPQVAVESRTTPTPAAPPPAREHVAGPQEATVDAERELARHIEEQARLFEQLARAAQAGQDRTSDQATEAMRKQIEEVAKRFETESWNAYIRETQDSLRALAEETQDARAQERAKTDTEEFLRAQIREMAAQLERQAQENRPVTQNWIDELHRQRLLDTQRELVQQRQIAEAQLLAQRESLASQLNVLREQQQALIRQIEQIAEQQKALVEMQRRMAEETGRLREALKSR